MTNVRPDQPPFSKRARPLLVAAVGGLIASLPAPPTDLHLAILVGMALLACAIADAPSFWRAFGRGVVWGTVAQVIGLRFVPDVIQRFTAFGPASAYLALLLIALWQSLIWAAGAGVATLLFRRLRVPFEIAFAIGIFVTLSLPTVFAWSPAGLLTPIPSLVQLADVLGDRGLSALLALACAFFARGAMAFVRWRPGEPMPADLRVGVDQRGARMIGATLLFFVVLVGFGSWRMAAIASDSEKLATLRVGLVDQALDPHVRWNPRERPKILRTLRRLTHQAEEQGAELTVWPEGAFPYRVDHSARTVPAGREQRILGGQRGNGVHGPLLIGLITRTDDGPVPSESCNSATVITPDGAMQEPYDKLQLLWFGEMVPLGKEFPWLRRAFSRGTGMVPGEVPRALTLPRPSGGDPIKISVLNCYEDTLTDVGRKQTAPFEPDLLVNITNDAWFFGTVESDLHARLGALRAVEHRRDLVRAVNWGVSTWVDATGEVRARYAGDEPDVLMATPSLRPGGLTLFGRFGDAPALALLGIAAAVGAWRARRGAASASAPEPIKPPPVEAGAAATAPTPAASSEPAEPIASGDAAASDPPPGI